MDRRGSSGNSSFLVLRRSAGSGLPTAAKPLTLLDRSGHRHPSHLLAMELLVGGHVFEGDADLVTNAVHLELAAGHNAAHGFKADLPASGEVLQGQ